MACRHLKVFPDGVFPISCAPSPKVWSSFWLKNLIYDDEPLPFAKIESRIPGIYFSPDRRMQHLRWRRILKSHKYFRCNYRRIVHLVRDRGNVAVFCYHHNLKRGNIPDVYPINQFVLHVITANL